ncbi:hypothetical protein [Marinomonas shanghaiensis]|jgi:hypothetical protein|uniref:hypothetical protein n=1 Tax=Marinomonas shanghaiensis TaxID=2202418 RepID=UPI000DB9BF43|nr:hypothetical protein [Marinomonas shanghaiensis]
MLKNKPIELQVADLESIPQAGSGKYFSKGGVSIGTCVVVRDTSNNDWCVEISEINSDSIGGIISGSHGHFYFDEPTGLKLEFDIKNVFLIL